MDIRTAFVDLAGDWTLSGPALAADEGLETAVILSLFTDRLAEPDDRLDGRDRRGWWGDSFPVIEGDRIGSRLWLLAREKQTASTLNRAREYAREALQWLVEDGVAAGVQVDAEYPRPGLLALIITITRPDGTTARFRFDNFWRS